MTSVKDGTSSSSASLLCRKLGPFIEVIQYDPEDFISIIKTSFIYQSINIVINIIIFHTFLGHYILSVSLGSLLSVIVRLLLQINGHKNMHTALFCVVCAVPFFIIIMKQFQFTSFTIFLAVFS